MYFGGKAFVTVLFGLQKGVGLEFSFSRSRFRTPTQGSRGFRASELHALGFSWKLAPRPRASDPVDSVLQNSGGLGSWSPCRCEPSENLAQALGRFSMTVQRLGLVPGVGWQPIATPAYANDLTHPCSQRW